MSNDCGTDEIKSHIFEPMSPLHSYPRDFCSPPSSPISNPFYSEPRTRKEMSAYEPIQTIGSGSFGKIVRIRRKCDDANLVWKELDFTNMTSFEKKQVGIEINLLRSLSQRKHPHIVRYHDNFSDCIGKTFIIMEYCENGDLASLIESHRRNRTWAQESFIWKILGQVTSALKECHRRYNLESNIPSTILHRDLKPANVLLDKNYDVKICDFGLATEIFQNDNSSNSGQLSGSSCDSPIHLLTCPASSESDQDDGMCGTPFYMAPERVNRCNYDERSDIWSLGCIVYELAALRHPFMAENESELANRINSGYLARLPNHFSPDLQSTCKWMLRHDVTRRPTAEDILRLPQLHAVLSEVRHKRCEVQLEERRLRFEFEVSRRKRKLEQREKYLIDLECRLRDRESNLIEREKRIENLEQYSHSHYRTESNKVQCHESLHIPHLIDDPPREHSPCQFVNKYPSMHPVKSFTEYRSDQATKPRSDFQIYKHVQQNQLQPRRRKFSPVSIMTQACASPGNEHSQKRLRIERPELSPFCYRNENSMSPNLQCPAVSYEEYYFRRSRS